jgi:hypothetical protein
MAEEKKEEELFKRLESLGLRLEYDSGFLIVGRSASVDQRRDDDDAEIEQAIIEQIGKYMKELSSLAVGKARGARGLDFIDRQAFVPSIQAFGALADCTSDGLVKIAYRRQSLKDPEIDVDLIHSGSGADLLLILDERPAPASTTSFTWIADERLRRLFERARAAGLTLAHDSGFTVVKWGTMTGVEPAAGSSAGVIEGIIRELGAKLGEVSALMAARSRGERGSHFVGRRVLVPVFFNAFGILVSSDTDGSVDVTYRDKHTGSERRCHVRGDDLLVVPDEEAAKATSAEQGSEESGWRKLVRRVFGD